MGTDERIRVLPFSLFGKARGAVLALLYGRPDESFYVREIVRAAGAGQGAIQRELQILTAAGILERCQRNRQVYYRASPRCSFFSELRGLMLKTEGLAGVVGAFLDPLDETIELAFLYGSQAGGTATAASDVDLFVIGGVDEMRLHRAVSSAERKLGRAINYTLMRRDEFDRRRREKGGFLDRVLAGPKVIIRGDADEIR